MKTYSNVIAAKPMDDHRIEVTFECGRIGVFDMVSYFDDPYWSKLRDPSVFRQVRVSFGTLVWPEDIDVDPEEVWQRATDVYPLPLDSTDCCVAEAPAPRNP